MKLYSYFIFLYIFYCFTQITSLSGIERTLFYAVANSARIETSYTHAVQHYNQSVTLYERRGRKRIGAYIGLARALYKRDSGDDRMRAQEVWLKAQAVVPVSAEDRVENADLQNGIDFVPKWPVTSHYICISTTHFDLSLIYINTSSVINQLIYLAKFLMIFSIV